MGEVIVTLLALLVLIHLVVFMSKKFSGLRRAIIKSGFYAMGIIFLGALGLAFVVPIFFMNTNENGAGDLIGIIYPIIASVLLILYFIYGVAILIIAWLISLNNSLNMRYLEWKK